MSAEQDMTNKILSDQMIDIMKNKSAIIKEMLRILEDNKRYDAGLDNFIKAIDEGKTSNAQLAGMLKTIIKIQKDQSNAIRQLSMFGLILASSGELSKMAGTVACNMGNGKEVIREMFKQKMER